MKSQPIVGLCRALMLCVLLVPTAASGAPITYLFTLNSANSTTSADLQVAGETSGTMAGNHDPATNPTGTRTKPGLLGSFEDTENVPVPVTVDPSVEGAINSRPAGTFLLILDPQAASATLTGLSTDLLTGGPVTLPVNAAIGFGSFRTRNPSSTYFATNTTLPVGDAIVNSLKATQTDPASGTLTPTGNPDEYAIAITALVTLEADVDFEGNALTAPTDPIALPLTGTVKLTGDTASLVGSINLALDQTDAVPRDLPPFDFPLPTLLPPGGTANLVLDLTLNQSTTTVTGTSTLNAAGVIVPEPAGIAALAFALGLLLNRRH